ncbi:MAG: hypothetical protein EXS15_01370 [Phycisphaerales bacterium]|nr:hypothetical protein [Phycisphaerales bacterium]
MTSPAKAARIDDLMHKAHLALKSGRWFEAERVAQRAMEISHEAGDFGRMARIVMPLQESRRQRMQLASEVIGVKWIEGEITEDHRVGPGMHIMQPPLVGADARRVRLTAIRREVPALVLCREPTTRLGEVPIVAIGLMTVRVRIAAPDKPAKPTKQWFLKALEQLGDAAIGMIDTGMDAVRQVDFAMSLLDSVPDHEELHTTVAALCQRAESEMRENPAGGASTDSKAGSHESARG